MWLWLILKLKRKSNTSNTNSTIIYGGTTDGMYIGTNVTSGEISLGNSKSFLHTVDFAIKNFHNEDDIFRQTDFS